MKPIYKSLLIEAAVLSVSLSLQAQVTSGEDVTTQDVQAESLEGLKVVLISPNVSGAKDLIASGECELNGANIIINLQNLTQGIHRVQVSAVFGTQTCVIYALDLTVPAGALSDTPQEFTDEVTVVSTIGDAAAGLVIDPTPTEGSTNPVASGGVYTGLAGRADGSVYQVGQSGEEGSEVENVAKVRAHSVELSNTAVATGENAVAEGNRTTASGDYSHAEGLGTNASKKASHAEGLGTNASGDYSHAEGLGTNASEEASHAEGVDTTASGNGAHAEGNGTSADADNSHAEGVDTTASGNGAHAEGNGTSADADNSHAEGNGTTASGDASHAEGNGTIADRDNSHAEGNGTTASGDNSHAEGSGTKASGNASHAEGSGTIASGIASHAEGGSTTASGDFSHAEGVSTIASQEAQHVSGKYNVEDTNGDYAFIVGNGTADDARSNAFAIDWNGNLVLFNAGTPVVLTPAKLAQLIA